MCLYLAVRHHILPLPTNNIVCGGMYCNNGCSGGRAVGLTRARRAGGEIWNTSYCAIVRAMNSLGVGGACPNNKQTRGFDCGCMRILVLFWFSIHVYAKAKALNPNKTEIFKTKISCRACVKRHRHNPYMGLSCARVRACVCWCWCRRIFACIHTYTYNIDI